MFKTTKGWQRRAVALPVAALTMSGALAAFAGSAYAAGTLAVTPTTQSTTSPGTLTYAYTLSGGDLSTVRYNVLSGPDAGQNGVGTAPTSGNFTVTNSGTPGTDSIRAYADENSNNAFDPGEPAQTVTGVFTGAPAQMSIAQASPSVAVNACDVYTITVKDSGGQPINLQAVDFTATQTSSNTSDTLTECSVDSNNNSTPGASSTPGTTTTLDQSGTTGTDGTVKFGVASNTPGTVTVRAFIDGNANNTFDAGELTTGTKTETVTAGGSDEAAKTLTLTPASQTEFLGDTATLTAHIVNTAGDPVPGITPSAKVTGANAGAAITCGQSNNNGDSACSYAGTTGGQDTVQVWINQAIGNTSGADAGEPQATATVTWTSGTANRQVAATCTETSSYLDSGQSNTNCIMPTDVKTNVITATVTDLTGPTNNRVPTAGAPVRFTITSSSSSSRITISPASATTGSDGKATATVTNSAPVDSDTATVRIDTPTAAGYTSATVNLTWYARDAYQLTIVPSTATEQQGTSHTVNATLVDEFGSPVSGDTVDFALAGGSRNYPLTATKTTNASGVATWTYQDNPTSAATSDTINAAAAAFGTPGSYYYGSPSPASQTVNWVAEAPVAAAVTIDMQNCDATYGGSPSYPVSGAQSSATDTVGAPGSAQHEICAVVRSASGGMLEGTSVTFTSSGVGHFVDSNGTSLGTSTSAFVDSSGRAHVLASSTESGTETVTATANGHSSSGTLDWAGTTARTIACTPTDGQANVGSTTDVTCLVEDRYGNPSPGASVNLTITGAGQFYDINCYQSNACTDTTNSAGLVVETIRSTTPGTSTVTGTITGECTDPAGVPADASANGVCSSQSKVTWLDRAPASITVAAGAGAQGASNTATATVKNAAGDPLQDITVRFSVSGSNSASGSAVTNASGVATFNYTPSNAGTDTITAFADTNGDGLRQSGEPQGSATSTISAHSSTLKITSPSTYYTTVPGGSVVKFTGSGGNAGDVLTVHRKVGNGTYGTLTGPTVASDGTWSYNLKVTTSTAVYFSGANGSTGVKVILTTLNITVPSTYYTTVAKGQRVAIYGSGARPGAVLSIWTKSGSQTTFLKRTNTVTATSYGTWALRFNVYQTMAIYFTGANGKSDTVVYRVS